MKIKDVPFFPFFIWLLLISILFYYFLSKLFFIIYIAIVILYLAIRIISIKSLNLNKFSDARELIPFLTLIIPPFFVIGTIFGWSQFVTTEEFWVLNFYEFPLNKIIFFGLINLIAVIFFVWKETNYSGEIKPCELLKRSGIVFIKGIIISCLIGCIFINIYGYNFLGKFKLLERCTSDIWAVYEDSFREGILPECLELEIKDLKSGKRVFFDKPKKYLESSSSIFFLFFQTKIFLIKILYSRDRYEKKEIKYNGKKIIFTFLSNKSQKHLSDNHEKSEKYDIRSLYLINSPWCHLKIFSDLILIFINVLISGSFMALFFGVVIQFIGESIR